MMALKRKSRRSSGSWALSPQARTTTRLAVVACTVLAIVAALGIVGLQAHRAEEALDDSTAQTLRDYTGYAGRLMGADVLRRFREQRSGILAPVSGSARRPVNPPALDEIVHLGDAYFTAYHVPAKAGLGYFRIATPTGAVETRGSATGSLGGHIADTLRTLAAHSAVTAEPDVLAITHDGAQHSVAYARLIAPDGHVAAMYGFTYLRSVVVGAVAERVFAETPLLPTSFAGLRWNYDTTGVRSGEVVNDSLLGMRITDRGGVVLWRSSRASEASGSPYRQNIVLSTASGGLVVETALLPSGEPTLVPRIVRRAQRWSLGALFAITALLAAVSLLALGGERAGARQRRAEAMQQLALGLRHELNNALASVMLNAEMLRESSMDPDQDERLEAIVEQAARMRSVLRRLEKGKKLDVVVPYLNEGFMVDLSGGGTPLG
ncbi:MAG: histidine kinase dimerization/phospho-acceptor domain-containing protein [bacterium]